MNDNIITQKQTRYLQLSEQVVTNIDIEQLMSCKEYTAFEVFPTKENIPAGTIDNQEGVGNLLGIENYNGILPDDHVSEYKYTEEVLSSMTHIFTLGGFSKDLTDLDIVIDWGDRTITKLADLTVNSNTDDIDNLSEETKTRLFYFIKTNPYGAYIGHTYNKSQKYIIKVYGKDYNCLRCGSGNPDGTGYANPRYNTTCRILGADLPIASNIVNMSSFSGVTNRLLKIIVPYEYNFKNANNFSGMFGRCYNLLYVDCNSSTKFNVDGILTLQTLLCYDRNLIYADLGLPSYMYNHGLTTLATDCRNLDVDIFNLLPKNNFKFGMDISMKQSFQNCNKISCSDYDKLANLLWNNKLIKFKDTQNCFAGCNNLSLDLIPKTWGGNLEEIIEPDEPINDYLSCNYLNDKTYVCFGDSFTKMSYPDYIDENGLVGKESDGYSQKFDQYKTYPVCIAERNNMKLVNNAQSGSSMFMPIFNYEIGDEIATYDYPTSEGDGFIQYNNGQIKLAFGKYTDYIAIDNIGAFKVTGGAYSYATILALYDADKNFIAPLGYDTTITAATNALVYDNKIIYADELKSIAQSKNKELKYIRASSVNNGSAADKFGLSSYAVKSYTSKITNVFSKNINKHENDIKTADYITIAFGLNDDGRIDDSADNDHINRDAWLNSMGEKTDNTINTMFGAYNVVLSAIFNWNPDVKIGLIINDSWMNEQVHDTIIEIANYWGIPYLDLKNDKSLPLMLQNRYDNSVNKYLVDKRFAEFNYSSKSGHPNIKCHMFRSSIIEDFLKRL